MYLKYKASKMRIITTLLFTFILVSCSNNYGDTNIKDDVIINKTDIKNRNRVITEINTKNNSLLEDDGTSLIFDKINPLIVYDSQEKIEIRHDNTVIYINLFGGDESDLTLFMNGKVVNKGLNGYFNYTYGEDLQGALKKIKVFASNSDKKILILPTTTEQYPTYNALLFDDSGLLHSYTFEITEWNCANIESLTKNTQTNANANAIEVKDNTGKDCSTLTYMFDGKYIKEEPKLFSFTDIAEKYEENTHKTFTFDVNADGINDIVVSSINSDKNLHQGDDLLVFLGFSNDKYLLSLDSINYTEDGGFFFSDISPRPNNKGLILSIYFSSKGLPFKDYYFTLENNEWKVSKLIIRGYWGKEEFYCRFPKNYFVSISSSNNLETQISEDDMENNCPPPPAKYQVRIDRAEILNDNFESKSPPNYYVEGDIIEAFDQNEDWIKVAYKNNTKFGWIDKRDLSPVSD